MLDDKEVHAIRRDFPILNQEFYGKPLIYLDNAATTQVLRCVVDEIARHYANDNANVHRSVHALSSRSTKGFENARETVCRYIGASSSREIVFTSGTTASINLLAAMWAERLRPGDVVAVSALEHHSNLVPWQQVCSRTGADFKIIPLDAKGDVDLIALENLLSSRSVSLLSIAHVSNVLGTTSPLRKICALCHSHGTVVSVDAAQSARHEAIDVRELDCDFISFSGHKMCGPTGIGVLYGRAELLESLNPVAFGGEMVDAVSFDESTFEEIPIRFEPGTPNYVGAIALARAIDYLEDVGRSSISAYESFLIRETEKKLEGIEGIRILGSPVARAGCVSFSVEGLHPFDIASFMDKKGVAIRSGNQCAQPLLNEVYADGAICRISPAFYNTQGEIEDCIAALSAVIDFLRKIG